MFYQTFKIVLQYLWLGLGLGLAVCGFIYLSPYDRYKNSHYTSTTDINTKTTRIVASCCLY